MSDTDNPLLAAALDCAARGWPVFPCSADSKQPLVKSTEAGQGGLHLATTDAKAIRDWWRIWPTAMIGVPTGEPVGAFVVDLDPKGEETADELLRALLDATGLEVLPPGPMVATPRGGLHIWFAMPGTGEVRNRNPAMRTARGSLIDVRGTGGYVILPPSVRRGAGAVRDGCEGVGYRWSPRAGLHFPPAPAEIVTFVRDYGRERPASPAPRGGKMSGDGNQSRARPADVTDARWAAIEKYALTALQNQLTYAREAADGERNSKLNEAALKLGHLVGAGVLSEAVVRAALEDVASAWPNLRKSKGTISSGLRAGRAVPADLSGVGERAGQRYPGRLTNGSAPPGAHSEAFPSPPPPIFDGQEGAGLPPTGGSGAGGSGRAGYPGGDGGDDDARHGFDLGLAKLPLTDLGNSKRFLARFGEDFRWCKELGWLAWDGRRWRVEGEDKFATLLLDAAIRTVEMIRAEADALVASREGEDDPGPFEGASWGEDLLVEVKSNGTRVWLSDLVRKWAKASQSAGKIMAFPPLARKALRIDRAMLDADPWALTVLNGVLRIKSGAALIDAREAGEPYITLEPHRREDLSTHLAPVDYDPDATCPGYDAFFAEVQPDGDMRRALHQWAGMSGTGNTGTRAFVWHYGPGGSNGKSTWANAIRAVYGDYALQIKIETILSQGRNRRGGEATPDLAELPGVRAIFCSEPDEKAEISENLIKDLTGGDPITCRTLYGPMFRFEMVGKLSVNGNHEPKLRSTDDAIWGRLKIVPWLVSIPDNPNVRKTAEYFNDMWIREGSGILNRLLDGLRDWLDNGLTFPAAVAQATAEHRADSDVVGTFIEQCLQRVPPEYDCRVQSTLMHQLYCAWAKANGHRENSQKWFKEKMEEKGFSQIKSSVVFWVDVHMLYLPSTFVTPDGDVVQHTDPPVPQHFRPVGRDVPPTREGG